MTTAPERFCGACTRAGTPCQRSPTLGKARCRLHGGAEGSGAPSGERNGRYRHGRYSKVKRAERVAEANRPWKPLPPPPSLESIFGPATGRSSNERN